MTEERVLDSDQRSDKVTPGDIRALRMLYGLSQRALGRLLGWGEITIHRYEHGAVPDSAHSDVLFLLQDARAMMRYLERYNYRLTDVDRQHIRNSLVGRILQAANSGPHFAGVKEQP